MLFSCTLSYHTCTLIIFNLFLPALCLLFVIPVIIFMLSLSYLYLMNILRRYVYLKSTSSLSNPYLIFFFLVSYLCHSYLTCASSFHACTLLSVFSLLLAIIFSVPYLYLDGTLCTPVLINILPVPYVYPCLYTS